MRDIWLIILGNRGSEGCGGGGVCLRAGKSTSGMEKQHFRPAEAVVEFYPYLDGHDSL